MKLLNFENFHLVGIKGVAMTSMAQLLLDAGKKVTGVDVREDFVTKGILGKLADRGVGVKFDFGAELPEGTEVVIYTAAHDGPNNPQVILAKEQDLPTFSQAEALGAFFNSSEGIAVCGVGGKSSVSAMIAFIFQKISSQSFSVGVGDIAGLGKTGQWLEGSNFFVAEADEYVTDPHAPGRGEEITPRFSYLNPKITVCTNLQFDHPDVYRDFDHTKQVYGQFFEQIKMGGSLVINGDDEGLKKLSEKIAAQNSELKILKFGESGDADFKLVNYESREGLTISDFEFRDQSYQLKLQIPGKYNVMNGLSAIAACQVAGIRVEESIEALAEFSSTMRRFELIGEKAGVKYYDDYAHHPKEIAAVIKAFSEWYPDKKKIIAFQSHTFSRTKELFDQFAESFDGADKVVMIDIFPSAREEFDKSITSDLLCEAINKKDPQVEAENLRTIENLAEYFKNEVETGSVILTVGAGDIYEVHELI
jgi:UDP-N-acetylmuramate--alanine ligase